MNLYLITQTENRDYDTYDSAVVAAESEEAARCTHPRGENTRGDPKTDIWEEYGWLESSLCLVTHQYTERGWEPLDTTYAGWTTRPSLVTVTLIGEAVRGTRAGVICASFNAG